MERVRRIAERLAYACAALTMEAQIGLEGRALMWGLLTLAFAGLAINWPALLNRSTVIRWRFDGGRWHSRKIPRKAGPVHHIPLLDDGRVINIDVPDDVRIHFIDTPNWDSFWTEAVIEDRRRYTCRYIPPGSGYKQVFVTLTTTPSDD